MTIWTPAVGLPYTQVGTPYTADLGHNVAGLGVITATLISCSVANAVITNRLEGDVNYANLSFTVPGMPASRLVHVTIKVSLPDSPTVANTFSYAITVVDTEKPPNPPPPSAPQVISLIKATMSHAVGTVNISIARTVNPSFSGTWSLLSRGNLPVDATITNSNAGGEGNTCHLSGTFPTIGDYAFSVSVSHPGYISANADMQFRILADPPVVEPPVVEPYVYEWLTLSAVKDVPFSGQVWATHNPPLPVTGAATLTGMPPGTSMTAAGLLTATFTAVGVIQFFVQLTDSNHAVVANNTCRVLVTGTSIVAPPPLPPEPPQVKITKESYSETEWLLTHTATDTDGVLLPTQDSTGTVSYDSGMLYFPPEMLFDYKRWSIARENGTGEWIDDKITDTWASGAQISVTYQNQSVVPTEVTETLPPNVISINLTPYSADSIVPSSVKFTIGSTTYTDLEGVMYHTPDVNGYGTRAGVIDYASGYAVLDNWVAGSPTFTLLSLALMKGTYSDTAMFFRIPSAPIKQTAFTLSVTAADGELLSATADLAQELIGTGIVGTIDAEFGLCSVRFGATVLDSSLTAEEKAEEWYDAADVVGGNIWKPRRVIPGTARYNTVAFTTIPLSADVLGIDPVRLPSDGKVPSLLKGQLILIHQTTAFFENSLSPTQVLNCGRTRLYRAVIAGANGVRLSPEHYTLNRELGTITMSPTLSLTGLTSPYTIEHTIADLCVIADNDLSGWLTLTRPISHTYPTTSFCSGLMYIGTMQARVTALFAQSTWTSVWSDALIGSEPLAQYNDAQYPIVITNAGAYPDRILVKFTSATAFQVIGEQLGIIGTGDIDHDCSPLNSLTGVAYFTIDYHGWGVGWATGNCLRFNVVSASYPVDLIRSIQPSDPSGLDVDSVELLLLGNIDR